MTKPDDSTSYPTASTCLKKPRLHLPAHRRMEEGMMDIVIHRTKNAFDQAFSRPTINGFNWSHHTKSATCCRTLCTPPGGVVEPLVISVCSHTRRWRRRARASLTLPLVVARRDLVGFCRGHGVVVSLHSSLLLVEEG